LGRSTREGAAHLGRPASRAVRLCPKIPSVTARAFEVGDDLARLGHEPLLVVQGVVWPLGGEALALMVVAVYRHLGVGRVEGVPTRYANSREYLLPPCTVNRGRASPPRLRRSVYQGEAVAVDVAVAVAVEVVAGGVSGGGSGGFSGGSSEALSEDSSGGFLVSEVVVPSLLVLECVRSMAGEEEVVVGGVGSESGK